MKQPNARRRIVAILGALLTLVLGIGITIVATDDGGDNPSGKHHRTVTVHVGGGTAAATSTPGNDPTVALTPAAQAYAKGAASSELGHHDDLRNEDPAGVSNEDLAAGALQQDELAKTDNLPIVTPDAAPQQAGCTTHLVRNFSSRRGVRPRLFVLHYTVSPNRPGWGDVNAVVSLFDRSAFQASSNYVIDNEGNCAYIVRESDKAWTQAAANPVSISVEVINTGHEPTYAGSVGLAKIARVIHDADARWAIPNQRGAVNGCTVARAGIIDHHSLGACGGGHFDIQPPYSVDAVIAAVHRLDHRTVSALDRLRCRRLNHWRKAGRPAAFAGPAIKRKHTLAAHRVFCQPNQPTHVIT